jgi:K+-transporting ATPase A subunit
MTINGWIQIAIFCAIVAALVKPLGWYMTAVFNGCGPSKQAFIGSAASTRSVSKAG